MGLGRKEPSFDHARHSPAAAATASVLIARLVQMPEAYWAAIATLAVMQSTLGATLTLSIERIVATAVGASVGALEANFFGANLIAFAIAIVLIGLLSITFRLEKTAYRYASIRGEIKQKVTKVTKVSESARDCFERSSFPLLSSVKDLFQCTTCIKRQTE